MIALYLFLNLLYGSHFSTSRNQKKSRWPQKYIMNDLEIMSTYIFAKSVSLILTDKSIIHKKELEKINVFLNSDPTKEKTLYGHIKGLVNKLTDALDDGMFVFKNDIEVFVNFIKSSDEICSDDKVGE